MSFRYFVIGAGSIGTRHFNNLKMLGVDVVHVPWRSMKRDTFLSALHAARGNAGVVIATATKIRLPLITEIAATGASLYIEKPIAFHAADIQSIFTLPDEIQRRSMSGFMMRYHPLIQHLATRPISNLFRAQIEIGHDVTQWRENWTFADSYAADPDGGGVLLDLCHEIDLAHLMCGALDLRTVDSTHHPAFQGVDIHSHLTLTSPTGTTATVSMDYLAPKLIRRGRLVGLDAQIDYDLTQNQMTTITASGTKSEKFPLERNDMFIAIMRDFIALSQGREPENPIAPRLDRTRDVCHLIAQAWAARRFTGQLEARLT